MIKRAIAHPCQSFKICHLKRYYNDQSDISLMPISTKEIHKEYYVGGQLKWETKYYENGELRSRKYYDNEQMWRDAKWDDNGKMRVCIDYSHGVLKVEYRWNDKGKLCAHKKYQDGQLEHEQEWDGSGNLKTDTRQGE